MGTLGHNCYGKSRVRLSRITRHGDFHEFNEWTVRALLEGEVSASFTESDNSSTLLTDTMKNTVCSVARGLKAATIEEFATELGDYLLAYNPQVSGALIEIEEKAWERMKLDGAAEATTFKLGGPELHTVRAVRDQGREWSVRPGIDGLVILKTTKSASTGFVKDKLTTLKPATDQILGTRATATWEYSATSPDHAQVRARIIAALLKEFAAHNSMSAAHPIRHGKCRAGRRARDCARHTNDAQSAPSACGS